MSQAPKIEAPWSEADLHIGGSSFIEVDEEGKPLVLSRPKPRGLLPVPPEVRDAIARECERLDREFGIVPTPEAVQRMIDSITLQYYYEGFDVAYRHVPGGVEILAVGVEEIGQLFRDVDPSTWQEIRVGQP